MATARISESVRRFFAEAFTARDLAEPLASFDADTPSAAVREFMRARDFSAVGVRTDGQVAGYVEQAWLGDGACGPYQRGFAEAVVVDDSVPLPGVVTRLNQTPVLFVRVLGQVGGIIGRDD